jgi:hypothetical protein
LDFWVDEQLYSIDVVSPQVFFEFFYCDALVEKMPFFQVNLHASLSKPFIGLSLLLLESVCDRFGKGILLIKVLKKIRNQGAQFLFIIVPVDEDDQVLVIFIVAAFLWIRKRISMDQKVVLVGAEGPDNCCYFLYVSHNFLCFHLFVLIL